MTLINLLDKHILGDKLLATSPVYSVSYSTISKAYNTVTWQGNTRRGLRSTEVKTTAPATVGATE